MDRRRERLDETEAEHIMRAKGVAHAIQPVAKDTIEEKIVALHKTKRDLADSLLKGSDRTDRMSTKDLMGLLKG